jgi:RNA-directed DNA polymerase
MQEPDDVGLASHIGPESCADVRKGGGEALTGVHVGWVLSREIPQRPGCRRCENKRKATPCPTTSQVGHGSCAVEDPMHAWMHLVREPGDPLVALGHQGRIVKSQDVRR